METVEVLIRIPKKEFEELQGNYVWWGRHGEYIKKGTVLPNNATNGDVIQALYPDATNYGINDGLVHICLDNRTITTFTSSWWNSPYIGYWG